MLSSRSVSKSEPSKKLVRSRQTLLAACFMLVSCLAYSLTLMMKDIFPSEMSVDFHKTTPCYTPVDRNLSGQFYSLHLSTKFKESIWPSWQLIYLLTSLVIYVCMCVCVCVYIYIVTCYATDTSDHQMYYVGVLDHFWTTIVRVTHCWHRSDW
jgi:hypothetical protein